MGQIIVKPASDRDEYVIWSSIVEAPVGYGNRAEILTQLREDWDRDYPHATPKPGFRPEDRLGRVDANGSSAAGDYTWGYWDHDGFIYEQRGWLPRQHLYRACELLDAGREAEVWDLLTPFEGETEVRRG